ncbi:hypothetical protein [Cyanobium sp. FACHB-13342]|uniref:hypothetical protein n=1 Tax=Cyanobium sp. FACHB-13342 TaxID=2692793 RepID=UPI001680FAA7|nr:hypothetical protein [Cyanobium sp. FACHB-13342]MBD2424257.1 hypothetical protein [Cyanobium sp. FACHB-13342]
MHSARAISSLIGIVLLGSLDLGAQAQPANQEAAEPPSTETPAPSAASPWAGTVELYGFAPIRSTGTTTIKGFSTDTDLSLGDALSKLKWATSIRGSIEHGRIGLLTDLSYVKLGQYNATTGQRGIFTGQAEVAAVQGIYDLALRYRFGDRERAVGQPGQFSVIPYAGIRIIDAQLDVSAQVDVGNVISFQPEGNYGRTWVQPLIGTQASVFLSPRLRAFARADIGGFNLSGTDDLSGNAQIGLGYAIGNNTDLNISWRYLGLDYNNGDTPDSGFSSYQNGVEIGLKFFF